MAVQTDVINRALFKIGVSSITSPTDNSAQARAATTIFASVAQAELRKQAWSFAMGRATLGALAAAPSWGYKLQFQLPSDCLRVVYIDDITDVDWSDAILGTGKPVFVIEGRQLLTDQSAPLYVRYIRDLSEDTTLWDACFCDVFACALAIDLAPILVKSDNAVKRAQGFYRDALFEAKRANAIEQPQQSAAAGSWGAARLY